MTMKSTTMQRMPKVLRKGFTLAELLVAMAITLVLISVTVQITGTALDAWRGAQGEIRASKQAQVMLSTMATDLRGIVLKSNTRGEWLRITSSRSEIGPDGQASPNPTRISFFTSALDRYQGATGGRDGDKGGNVSLVQYELAYGDPIFGESSNTNLETFVMYRSLVNPDETFESYLGRDNLNRGSGGAGATGLSRVPDYLCEGIYEFTVMVTIDYLDQNNVLQVEQIPVIGAGTGSAAKDLAFRDGKIVKDGSDRNDFAQGRIRSIDISATVLTEEGLRILKNRRFSTGQQQADFINEHTHQFSQSVSIPQP